MGALDEERADHRAVQGSAEKETGGTAAGDAGEDWVAGVEGKVFPGGGVRLGDKVEWRRDRLRSFLFWGTGLYEDHAGAFTRSICAAMFAGFHDCDAHVLQFADMSTETCSI